MRNLETIQLKTKEMLECFGQNTIHLYFHLFLRENIGIEERKELRKKLINQIKSHKDFKKQEKDFNWSRLLEIGIKPVCPFASLSISHCGNLGACFFIFDKTVSIGLDVERKKRITKAIVNRISSKKEVQQSPSPSLLWVAKEASFKCLSDNQSPLLLSDCLISKWKKEKTKEIYFFDFYSKTMGKKSFGTACFIDDLALAYAEVKSESA